MTEYYPGSARPVGKRPEPVPLADWGSPRIYTVAGREIEFYSVGQLAAALRRSSNTVRRWERSGWLPIATFRTPAAVKQKARRLYTRSQLETIVLIAQEEGLMEFVPGRDGQPWPRRNVQDTRFVERVREALRQLDE